jgi:hypothetical protein
MRVKEIAPPESIERPFSIVRTIRYQYLVLEWLGLYWPQIIATYLYELLLVTWFSLVFTGVIKFGSILMVNGHPHVGAFGIAAIVVVMWLPVGLPWYLRLRAEIKNKIY